MKEANILALVLLVTTLPVMAQWAVYDNEVYKQLALVNKIKPLSGFVSDKPYEHFDAVRDNDTGDIKMGSGDSFAVLKGLQTKFGNADAVPDLTKEEMARYVGTEADCGQKETNPKHYEACMGLRNLRLQTLVQSHSMLKNLALRRDQIVALTKKTREWTSDDEASLGKMQRAMFEIQRQQALMQADALQIEILMDGYQQQKAATGIRETGAVFLVLL